MMFNAEQKSIEKAIQAYCAANGLPEPGDLTWNPIPFSGEWGISTNFFPLAAVVARQVKEATGQGVNVPQRAQEIAQGVAAALGQPAGFTRVEAVKGYLNLYFSSSEYARRVIDNVLGQGNRFGWGEPKGQRVMVEFSQPNTHKAMHVGHLRSAILGDALARIIEAAGYQVVRANYLGDMGLHVIKWLWNYMKYHAGEKPSEDITRWMGDIYAEANRRLEENPELESEVRELYQRWDRREPDVVNVWKETRQWSLDGFQQIYQALNIRFDRDYFNSEEEHPGKAIVAQLVERGIAIDERPAGPVVVKLDEHLGLTKEKYRVLVVLRSDGTALYSTEDLALGVQKFTDYPDLVKSIYVVDVRQSLHFTQVFKTLEIAGYPWADRCHHVAYEVVVLPGNVILASRDGNVVLLENLIREAISRSLEVGKEKNPDLDDSLRLQIARAVGLGAIKFPLLARDNAKIATFDWQSALDFNGQAAPYIQYAHVRANSILRKVDSALPPSLFPEYDLDPTEVELIDRLSRFPGEVQRAANELKPLHITNSAYEIAKAFTDFYNACPVIKAEPDVRDARLRLAAAARQTIANALNLLGIEAPDVM
jgi:arginyl-tRNA synthetase